MKAMIDQVSIFEMLDEYETAELLPEEQKKGKTGWIIQFSGLFLKENGFKEDWHGVETRPIVFESDTRKDKYGMCQDFRTTKGPYQGHLGGLVKVYKSRPTWKDCLKYARENGRRNDPQDVRYYTQTADFESIYKYEKGY